MKVIIHRGTKEIGGSCVELIAESSRILIDFGMPLVNQDKEPFDSDSMASKSVIELKREKILPDIRGLYKNEKLEFDAILLSHSHLDHYGLLDFVNNEIPVYVSKGAKELVEITNIFINKNIQLTNTQIIKHKSSCYIKDFKITPYLVDHSAFDAFAFLIEAQDKRVFYSGDFRGHGRKAVLFKRMIKNPPKNIDCLLMEGSMLGRNETPYKNEDDIEARVVEILKEQKNITFLFSSSQNIDRLVSAYRACVKTDTIFLIDIYTAFVLQRLEKVSKGIPQPNWKNIRIKFFKYHADKLVEAGHKELLYIYNKQKIDIDELNEKKNKILMLARDNSIFPSIIRNIKAPEGAKIIYSIWEGYLTREFRSYCKNKGLVIEQVHTSGHAVLSDLQRFAEALNPKSLIPIHTFTPRSYLKLFKNVNILQNGEILVV
jgi:ribonuclease J